MLNVTSGSLPLPRRFARYARSSTCGERDHLSHVVGDPVVVLSGMSRQTHETGLNARQGMEGAKNAYRGFQEARRADTPNQGLSGRQEPRQPPAK
ncbi:rep protein, partial [Escherichia coli]